MKRTVGSSIRFTSFPQTERPPAFVAAIVDAFRKHEAVIGTTKRKTGLQSNLVLGILKADLLDLKFVVEQGKGNRIVRPVFFGEDGCPTKTYSIDAFHPEWSCGLEIEAGRAIGGNAIYRDLIQSLVMVDLEHLCLGVPNIYRYGATKTYDYDSTVNVAVALYGHSRICMPYGLTVIGY